MHPRLNRIIGSPLVVVMAAALVAPGAAPLTAAGEPAVRVVATEPVPGLATPPDPNFAWGAEEFIARTPDGSRVVLGGDGDRGNFGLGSTFFALHMLEPTPGRSLWVRAAGGGFFLSNDRFLYWGSDNSGEGELGLLSIPDRRVLWTFPPRKSQNLRQDLWGTTVARNRRTGELALTRGGQSGRTSIWGLRMRDFRLRGITRPGAAPCWSPDGRRLLFTVPKDSDLLEGTFGVVRANRTGRQMLGIGQGFAWLPNSRDVLVARRAKHGPEGAELFRVDIERRRWRQIARVEWPDGWPASTWLSPSGRWLAYRGRDGVLLARTTDGVSFALSLGSGIPPFWGNDDTVLFTRTEAGWFRSRLEYRSGGRDRK